MDFRQLEVFLAIIKFKSFSKAAEHLYLTQPTVSNHLSNLERDLNTVLINRPKSNKDISLTKAGELLYDYAINIVKLRENAKFKLGEFRGKIVGNIEIASSTVPEQYIIPEIICEFNKVYPDVTFTISHHDSAQVVKGIINGDIDFGIVGAKIPHNQLGYVPLTEDELVVVIPYSDSNQNTNVKEICLKDLLKERFILREPGSGTRSIIEESFKKENIDINRLQVIAHIENTETIKQCIRRGLGISILSKRAIEDEVRYKLLDYINISDVGLKRNFYFVYHSQRLPSPLEQTFRKFVYNYFA